MIHYALRCGGDHEFDGWFASSQSFDAQARAGLLCCPVCAHTRVVRALMAPGVLAGGSQPAPPAPPLPATAPARPMPDGLRAALARVRAEVEQRCEHVGQGFAAEARAIHEGRAPNRGIYGQAKLDEVRALAEDGIDVASIPWVPLADS